MPDARTAMPTRKLIVENRSSRAGESRVKAARESSCRSEDRESDSLYSLLSPFSSIRLWRIGVTRCQLNFSLEALRIGQCRCEVCWHVWLAQNGQQASNQRYGPLVSDGWLEGSVLFGSAMLKSPNPRRDTRAAKGECFRRTRRFDWRCDFASRLAAE
jgi:hypothetical protein